MRNIISEFYGDGAPIVTEMVQSDLCVDGTTNKSGPQQDMDQALLPSATLTGVNYTQVGWFWTYTYNVVKYCNTVISRIDDIEWDSVEDRNHVLGSALFHRAYRYYRAVHQFGNVPFIDVWKILDEHPIFPSDGFKTEIKEELKSEYGAICSRNKISFSNRRVSVHEKS